MAFDEIGNEELIEKYELNGRDEEIYKRLSYEQKRSVRLLRNIPPMSDQDKRFKLSTAIHVAWVRSLDQIRKAIMVFMQKKKLKIPIECVEGELLDLINQDAYPLPDHSFKNREIFDKYKSKFPQDSTREVWDGVHFNYVLARMARFGESPEVFELKLKLAIEELKNR